MSVFANKKSIVHAGDGLKFVAAAPDVCKTPSPAGPIPVPYPNFAMSSDLGDGTKTVKIEGKSVAIKGATLKTSTGDEAGTAGGGIVSSKTKGAVKWLSCSMNVKFEGKGVILFLTPTMHNGNMSNSVGTTGGEILVDESINALIQCVHCGGDLDDGKIHPPLKTDDATMMTEANTIKGPKSGVRSAIKVEGTDKIYKVQSGGGGNGYGQVFNMVSGKELILSDVQKKDLKKPDGKEGANAIGNCAEPQVLWKAFIDPDNKNKPPWPQGGLKMGCVNSNTGKKRGPCATCKRTLVAMLCTQKPNQHVKKKEVSWQEQIETNKKASKARGRHRKRK